MQDFSYGTYNTGIEPMFDQELSEFMRPKYEQYLRRTALADTPEEKMKAELAERVTREAEQLEKQGLITHMPTPTPQRPPNRKRQPA